MIIHLSKTLNPTHLQSHSFSTHFQGLELSIFSGAQRVSKISAIAGFHDHAHTESSPNHNPETLWFVKVLCTIYIRSLPSLDIFSSSSYVRKNLSPFIAFEVIKNLHVKSKRPKLAFSFFEFTRVDLKLNHSFVTYNLLLRSFCEMGIHDLAKLVLDCMRIDGYLPDDSLLVFLVMSFANAGKVEVAKEMLISQSSGDKVGKINSFVCNNFLSLLVRLNRVNEAVGFFRDNILKLKCCYPDTCTFNIVLRGMCRVGEVDKASVFFNDMGSFGCRPDVVSYNTLINGFSRIGNLDRARELLRELQSQDGFSPDVVTYTSVISGYCKLGEMAKAVNLFDEMISNGIKPNLITFNALIDGFGKISDMVSALNMYARMLILGCLPDVVTFTSLMDGHCRMGQVDQGLQLWNEMSARKLRPNLYVFSVIINVLCKQNRLNEARDFLKKLKSRGDIIPKPFVYNPVIDGFCKAGNVEEANVIVAEMEEKKCNPDKLTFTILILGHCMKGRMVEAISIFNKMLIVNCAPDSITVNSLISSLLKAGMPREAQKIRLAVSGYMDSSMPSSRRTILDMDIPVAVSK